MNIDTLVRYLDRPDEAADWLRGMGFSDISRAHANLVELSASGMTPDLLAVLSGQLEEHLPGLSDPDMAVNTLTRFVEVTRSPLSLAALFERDEGTLPILLQLFSASQYLSDLLVADPESFDLLRMTEGQPVFREALVDELTAEIAPLVDQQAAMAVLRRFKRRETLRIAYGDIVRSQSVAVVARQISYLADAICESALQSAWRIIEQQRGTPRRADGDRARFVVLALGKLGGEELNYSSDVDLIFLYDADGKTDGPKSCSNQEFFDRLGQLLVKLLAEPTDLGSAYRVDLRLRPQGGQGPIVMDLESTLRYYDVQGRTWERQAFVKARPAAGDLELGRELLGQLENWIYRRYLGLADITGIKALKRRIEGRALREAGKASSYGHANGARDVKTGHGGIRDIEFVIQFLQLLNGSDLPEVRTGNTLRGIRCLEQAGCLTMQERTILEENYEFLRRIEHRLQLMFDLQTHTLPRQTDERRKLARRMGYVDAPDDSALARFESDLVAKTEINHKILDHLLHDAFRDESSAEPEVDLVLEPDPTEETIRAVLTRHGFTDVPAAYRNLMDLANEKLAFLSTRRCRHFLASIAPRLLAEIARTPDPDSTLVNLSQVSDSLGGKGVLWELFSANPATLKLYVELCGASPYLSGLLIKNPGMIDELMDSLVLDRLPTLESLQAAIDELCRNAEDVAPILHSFKNSMHLRVGVRDLLGKDDIRATHAALSDVAEVCLRQLTAREYDRLAVKHGRPMTGDRPCRLIVMALGKLGGREPNYHSDLDIVFLYEGEGNTRHVHASRDDGTTTNQHFFGQLGARIIKVVNALGPLGRLYELDARLRPTGKSGSLAVSLAGLARYFNRGQAQLWERQALCKARPVVGPAGGTRRLMRIVRAAIVDPPWTPAAVEEIRQMRYRLQETASSSNLKRGPGGTVDVEFVVQMLQMRHAKQAPDVLVPGTLEALDALRRAGFIGDDDFEFFGRSYRFLRDVEARLRLMNTTARHDMPEDERELSKLAYLLQYAGPEPLVADARKFMTENRRRFEQVFDRALRGP